MYRLEFTNNNPAYQGTTRQSGRKDFETQAEAQARADRLIQKRYFGFPERWVELDVASDWEASREADRKTEDGIVYIKVPNDYTYSITDVTQEYTNKENRKQQVTEARQYLRDLRASDITDAASVKESIVNIVKVINGNL